jgi:hypothetical protein
MLGEAQEVRSQFFARICLEPTFHCAHEWDLNVEECETRITARLKSIAQPGLVVLYTFQSDESEAWGWLYKYHFEAPASSHGLDGITVDYDIQSETIHRKLAIWCPDDQIAPELSALTRWCWDRLYGQNRDYDSYLEQLFGYFSDWGSPIFRLGNRLKLFSALTPKCLDELENHFAWLAEIPDPIVDMTNFERMGTLLYPTFKNFAQANPLVRWHVNEKAARALNDVGVSHVLTRKAISRG